MMTDRASFQNRVTRYFLGRNDVFLVKASFSTQSACTCVAGLSDSHMRVAFYFSIFLKIKRECKEKKGEVPVAKSVNDTHNGVLTWGIIELDSTQLSAKTNLSAQPTWECLHQNGTEQGGGPQASVVWKQLNATAIGTADLPMGSGAQVSYELSIGPQLSLHLLLDLSFSSNGLSHDAEGPLVLTSCGCGPPSRSQGTNRAPGSSYGQEGGAPLPIIANLAPPAPDRSACYEASGVP